MDGVHECHSGQFPRRAREQKGVADGNERSLAPKAGEEHGGLSAVSCDSSEAANDEGEESVTEFASIVCRDAAKGSLIDEDGQAMDGRPNRILGAGTSLWGEDAHGNEIIERVAEELKRCSPTGSRRVAVSRQLQVPWHREGSLEKARFGKCKVEIRAAEGRQSCLGAFHGAARRRHASDLVLHALGELTHSRDTHGIEQGIAVIEMTVRGVRDHSDAASRLSQHHRVRTRCSGQFDPASIRRCLTWPTGRRPIVDDGGALVMRPFYAACWASRRGANA